MVEVRGQSIRHYGGGKRRRGGGVRSGMRCVIYPCLTFAAVCSFSVLLRRQWQFAPRETPPVPQETASPSAPVVAFAISVTSLELPTASTMLDSAEVLIQSIRAACKLSRYRCEALAFTLPSVSQEGRQHLEGMGWRVVEKDLPVAVEDIENETYRKHVVKSGCCGANEFIKLHAYTLTQYHRVMHVDADTFMLHPMDELMESNASLVYTTDPAMATKGSKALPVQGGFLLVRPDLGVYDELRAIQDPHDYVHVVCFRQGDWKVGPGWRQSHIGYFYGGATIQGLLAYYYNIIAPGNATEVDR
ncbi:unnamed protein product [Ectocarpus sp. 12 AP-2014]